jgi:hypothetical protein
MTPEQFVARLADNKYFVETFFSLIDKKRNRVPFIFNPPQSAYYGNKTNNDLILKSRKEGFSSVIEADFLVDCLMKENQNAVTMAHTWEDTLIHLERVDYYLKNLGTKSVEFRVTIDKDTQREISFPKKNSRYWIGTAGSGGWGRGRDVTHLHLSEVSWYKDQSVITGVMEACVPGARKVLETTANGLEAFYRMWREAQDPKSGSPWKAHFFAWFEDPTNTLPLPVGVNFRPTSAEARMLKEFKLSLPQLNWWRNKRAEMTDKSKMPQEFPSTAEEAFIFSGRHVFDLSRLKEIQDEVHAAKPGEVGDLEDDGKDINFVARDEGFLTVYRHHRQGRQYLVCADVAEGIQDGDWSAAHVLDRSSWEQVAVWRGRTDPGSFGKILVDLAYYYNNAVLAPELNNQGWATVERIKAERYPHLLNTREIWPDDTPRDGFPMLSQKIKGMVITALRNALDARTVAIHNPVTVQEMQTYIEDGGQMNAQQDCHDDCVTSLAIGVYCLRFLSVEETFAARVPRTVPAGFGRRDVESVRRNRAGG